MDQVHGVEHANSFSLVFGKQRIGFKGEYLTERKKERERKRKTTCMFFGGNLRIHESFINFMSLMTDSIPSFFSFVVLILATLPFLFYVTTFLVSLSLTNDERKTISSELIPPLLSLRVQMAHEHVEQHLNSHEIFSVSSFEFSLKFLNQFLYFTK